MRHGALLLGALALAGCRSRDAGTPEAGGEPPATTMQVRRPAEPASLADIAPGDTAGALALIRRIMRQGDAILDSLDRRDTVLVAGDSAAAPSLTLWSLNGRPVKLQAITPNTVDRIPEETATWFRLGEINVVQQPAGVLLFEGDGIVFTTDEALVPVAMPDTTRMRLETEVVDSVTARLAVFGVRYH